MSENPYIAETIQELFKLHYVRLHNYARRIVESDEEADDVVADVFMELWHNRNDIDFSLNILSYLYRATSTRALNALRHKGVAPVRIDMLESINAARLEYLTTITETDTLEQHELHDEIEAAIRTLPDKCREVFRLSYIHGLKNQDIADTMDVSVRTVEAHMYKALKILRKKLQHLLIFAAIIQLFSN